MLIFDKDDKRENNCYPTAWLYVALLAVTGLVLLSVHMLRIYAQGSEPASDRSVPELGDRPLLVNEDGELYLGTEL